MSDWSKAAELEEAAIFAKCLGEPFPFVVCKTRTLVMHQPRIESPGAAPGIQGGNAQFEHVGHSAQQPVGMTRATRSQNGGCADVLVFQIS